ADLTAVHNRTRVRALGWARERVGRLLARDACLVRGRLRGPDPGAGARLAGDRARRAHADPGADRLGQDARCLPLPARPADAGTKRGAHLALSLERLQRLAGEPVQRIGLSATQRPLEEIGRFVSGGREIELVDAGRAKELDLKVVVPLDDMREPEEQQSIWPS